MHTYQLNKKIMFKLIIVLQDSYKRNSYIIIVLQRHARNPRTLEHTNNTWGYTN